MNRVETALATIRRELPSNPTLASAIAEVTLHLMYLIEKGDINTLAITIHELDLVAAAVGMMTSSPTLIFDFE